MLLQMQLATFLFCRLHQQHNCAAGRHAPDSSFSTSRLPVPPNRRLLLGFLSIHWTACHMCLLILSGRAHSCSELLRISRGPEHLSDTEHECALPDAVALVARGCSTCPPVRLCYSDPKARGRGLQCRRITTVLFSSGDQRSEVTWFKTSLLGLRCVSHPETHAIDSFRVGR